MKIYLDSLGSFYSINHEAKETRRINKSNERIGIISLIGIIMYIAFLISGWLKWLDIIKISVKGTIAKNAIKKD